MSSSHFNRVASLSKPSAPHRCSNNNSNTSVSASSLVSTRVRWAGAVRNVIAPVQVTSIAGVQMFSAAALRIAVLEEQLQHIREMSALEQKHAADTLTAMQKHAAEKLQHIREMSALKQKHATETLQHEREVRAHRDKVLSDMAAHHAWLMNSANNRCSNLQNENMALRKRVHELTSQRQSRRAVATQTQQQEEELLEFQILAIMFVVPPEKTTMPELEKLRTDIIEVIQHDAEAVLAWLDDLVDEQDLLEHGQLGCVFGLHHCRRSMTAIRVMKQLCRFGALIREVTDHGLISDAPENPGRVHWDENSELCLRRMMDNEMDFDSTRPPQHQ